MPAASLDQVYVTCRGCGRVAVSPPPPLAVSVRAPGHALVIGSLMAAAATALVALAAL